MLFCKQLQGKTLTDIENLIVQSSKGNYNWFKNWIEKSGSKITV